MSNPNICFCAGFNHYFCRHVSLITSYILWYMPFICSCIIAYFSVIFIWIFINRKGLAYCSGISLFSPPSTPSFGVGPKQWTNSILFQQVCNFPLSLKVGDADVTLILHRPKMSLLLVLNSYVIHLSFSYISFNIQQIFI